MASGKLSRAGALACSGCRHACHVMLYCDTKTQLFGRIPIRHIILMQMRFDGLLGFLEEETLEAGLSRELLEELGVALPISAEDHVDCCHAPASSPSSTSRLISHFYVKKMEEEQIKEVEKEAASTATDHGQEVLGMLVDSLLRLDMIAPEELHKALAHSLKIPHTHAEDLQAALMRTEAKRNWF
ncbi:hypothetical protein KUCAC02_013046 [Chaenocephalus aceratus]|uniref:Uncharacterized protein n=1 Tax=Chaenocephalus aceratus TaxID=36190 RepID=A0ACB9XE62_CHAAC|nr:hypothetical protein KUCAC02_013046 [Chaenocephalus aceratus]